MNRTAFQFIAAAAITATAAPAMAQITPINGTRETTFYGTPLATQTVQTGFGDANAGGPLTGGGSELDAGYARAVGNTLYVMLTGNLESNFNKLELFFDSKVGGQNTLDTDTTNGGTNPPNDGWAFNLRGLTFDTGFDADYQMIVRNGFERVDIDYAIVGGGATGFDSFTEANGVPVPNATRMGAGMVGPGPNTGFTARLGFDDTNAAGVTGGDQAADAAAANAVTTGIELAIPLSFLGDPVLGDTIKIMSFINNGDHNFLSNQFLGGLPAPYGNIGNPQDPGSNVDFSTIAGDQFISTRVLPLGDFNFDGAVDVSDLGILASNFRGMGTYTGGDATGDGSIDVSDLGILAANFRTAIPAATVNMMGFASFEDALAFYLPGVAVPEPTAALAAVAALPLMRRRR